MTNDYKDLLLKYLTGNLENDYSSSTSTPYYKDSTSSNVDSGLNETNPIKCKDSNGNYNGKTLFWTPGTNTLTLVDSDMNIIIKYDKYNTGTLFNRFLGLGVDEEGQFYGIDYVLAEQKYRFILLNNLSEPTKMPDGTLEYRTVLRQSYFVQGYTAEDDLSTMFQVYLSKSKASAVYYLGFLDSTGMVGLPSTLTINVGMANEWKRLPDIPFLQSIKLDFLCYFDSDDTPHASYFTRNDISEDIERCDAVGDSTPSYTTLIQWSDVLLRYGSYSNITCELKATGTNEYYLFMNLLNVVYADDYSIQTLDIYKNGFGSSTDDAIYHDEREGYYSYSRYMTLYPQLDDTGNLSLFYTYYDNVVTTDRLNYTFIPYDKPSDAYLYQTRFTSAMTREVLFPCMISTSYNLNKAILIGSLTGNHTKYIITFLYNKNNINTDSFESGNGDYKTLLPNQALLFEKTTDKLVFARNLYNFKVFGNKSTSILNVPNNALNDLEIGSNDLISYYNNEIVNNTEDFTKNIYEDLYINYFNTITMQNQDYSTYKDNLDGAIRINQSTNKLSDYENAKATKVKITYDDGTYRIGGVNNSINDGVCTYEFYVYVPDEKTIEKIEIMSEDEETIYQTIDYFPESLLITKTYKIQQDVRVE